MIRDVDPLPIVMSWVPALAGFVAGASAGTAFAAGWGVFITALLLTACIVYEQQHHADANPWRKR